MSERKPTGTDYGNDIRIRPFDFEFPDKLDPVWVPGNPWRSQFYNGVSLTMPHLEPFLCKTMREAMDSVTDDGLLADMRGFVGQEAQHYRCHRRLNEVLKAAVPEFVQAEAVIEKSYKRLSSKSLRHRLAYSAGFESMTNGFTNLLIGQRIELFANAEPHVTSFWIAHMVEETEHKTVAFDVYQYCFGDYWPRAWGVLRGSFGVLGLGLKGMFRALRASGDLYRPQALLGLARETVITMRTVLPYLLRALGPGYNPRQESEADWVTEWIAGYETLAADAPMPLIDTTDNDMPAPFIANLSTPTATG